MMKRALNVPGYHYNESEITDDEAKKKGALRQLSYYTQFRVFLEILVYEQLSQFFVFRWIFNIMRIALALLDFYPVLALMKFGPKYAYVNVMKGKK